MPTKTCRSADCPPVRADLQTTLPKHADLQMLPPVHVDLQIPPPVPVLTL